MRISRLHIENFRSIQMLDLALSDTTVFIGQNNAGKTAILDAVRIVLTRRWGQRGTGFTENDVHRPDAGGDPRTLPPVRIELSMEEPEAGTWDSDMVAALEDILTLLPIYLEQWALAARASGNVTAVQLGDAALRLIQSRTAWPKTVSELVNWLPMTADVPAGITSDAVEDKAAWEAAARAIRAERGAEPDLDELLQGISLRPKEPPLDMQTVRLLTIHAAKGLEFNYVWVMGMAEAILPSWQSLKATASPAELEEERRNCFVAITRTKSQLTLSHAKRYRNWERQPSRFLAEMSLAGASS